MPGNEASREREQEVRARQAKLFLLGCFPFKHLEPVKGCGASLLLPSRARGPGRSVNSGLACLGSQSPLLPNPHPYSFGQLCNPVSPHPPRRATMESGRAEAAPTPSRV